MAAEDIPFSAEVTKACEQNLCGRYGKSWTCPPGVGDREMWEQRVKSYDRAVVFTCKYELEDSFDFEGMMEGQQHTKRILFEILDTLRADGVRFLALGCEGCALCEQCTYPDAPCRFPEKAVVSVEACGIHVAELAKKIGIRYHNGENTGTYFCIVLFE